MAHLHSPVKYFLRDQIFFSFIPGDSDHENISALSQWWLKSRRLNGLIKILNLTINCWKILHTTHPFTDFFISPHVCPLTIFSSQALNLLLYTMHTILASKFGIYWEIMSQDFRTRTQARTRICVRPEFIRKIKCSLHTTARTHNAARNFPMQRVANIFYVQEKYFLIHCICCTHSRRCHEADGGYKW